MARAHQYHIPIHNMAKRLGLTGATKVSSRIWIAILLVAVALLLVHHAFSRPATLELERAETVATSATKDSALSADGNVGSDEQSGSEVVAAPIIVDVTGAVNQPGVYEVAGDARLVDCIEAAGGPSQDAYLPALNLASFASDGMQVYVPTLEEAQNGALQQGGATAASNNDGVGGVSDGKVNINTATAQELQALDGIGPSLAQRIIDDRESNGLFATIEDLQRVSGIGAKKYAAVADSICV